MTKLGDTIYQLTWHAGDIHIFDSDLNYQRTVKTPIPSQEGWGITHDGQSLLISDGARTHPAHRFI